MSLQKTDTAYPDPTPTACGPSFSLEGKVPELGYRIFSAWTLPGAVGWQGGFRWVFLVAALSGGTEGATRRACKDGSRWLFVLCSLRLRRTRYTSRWE